MERVQKTLIENFNYYGKWPTSKFILKKEQHDFAYLRNW